MKTITIRGLSLKIDLASHSDEQVIEAINKCNALLEFCEAEIQLPPSYAGPLEIEVSRRAKKSTCSHAAHCSICGALNERIAALEGEMENLINDGEQP